jgi:hypothetical protein
VRALRPQDLLPVEATYFDVAAATGGDFYFWSPGEFATAELRVPVGGESILLAYGELQGGARSFTLPVDALTGEIEVFAGAQRLDDVRLLDPRGATSELDPGSDWQRFERMRIVSVELPEAGEWRIELRGAGRFALTVRGRQGARTLPGTEPIEALDFDFVELRGRPGHEGFFPLEREVRPGERVALQIVLSGSCREVEALLVGLDARALDAEPITLELTDSGALGSTYQARVVIPPQPFRVLLRGLDAAGLRFQRIFDASVQPASTPPAARSG